MKKLLSFIILATGLGMAFAATPQQTMQQAAKAYQAKDYAQAQELYESLLKKGYIGADLYYNLGNACYRQNDIAHAVLYYERAHRLRPHDTDITENLELAQSKTQDHIEAIPQIFFVRWFHAVIDWLSPTGWGILALVVLALAIAAILLFRFALPDKRYLFFVFAIGILLAFLFFVNATICHSQLSNNKEAVVMPASVSVKGSPDAEGVEKLVLHAGTKVKVEERVNGWLKCSIADGNKGWLQESDIERI